MPFLCYWSNNPSYDWRQRTEDFCFSILRSRYGSEIAKNQLTQLEGKLASIESRTHWVAPPTHQIDFQAFDVIKAVTVLEEGFETLERFLLKMADTPQRKFLLQYSEFGNENLDYGEEL